MVKTLYFLHFFKFNYHDKKTHFYYFSVLFCSSDLNAQCTVHEFTDDGIGFVTTFPGFTIGQTFQACESGEVTSITFKHDDTQILPGTHEFRIAAITAPPTALISGPVYQTFDASGNPEILTITLNPPFAVTAGNDYAFELTAGSDSRLNILIYNDLPDDYPNGFLYVNALGSFDTTNQLVDMDFEVVISPAANPAAAEVPTVGEWGLLILALLFMTLGTLYLVQPNVEERIGK